MKKPTNILPADAYKRLLAQQERNARRALPRHQESALQKQCVAWFRAQYPAHALMLFAVPNGGGRSRTEAAIMNGEGVTAGVADLILLEARGGWGALCIEMKTREKGSKQRPSQKAWQAAAERAGNRYVVIRSFEAFQAIVREYMGLPAIGRGKTIDTEGWHDDLHEKPTAGTRCRVKLVYNTYTATWNGYDWIDDASGFRIMGVVGWMTFEELAELADKRLPAPPPPHREPMPF